MRKSWLVLLALFVVLFVGSLTAFAAPRPNDPPPIGGGGTTYPSPTFQPPSATPDLGTSAPTHTPQPTQNPLTPTPTRAGYPGVPAPKPAPICDCIYREEN